jgi:ribonuclease-3
MRAELALLEARLNYRFSRPELLHRALTHSSAAHEAHVGPCSPDQDNEQMEFLGDSILGFLTSEALVQRHPEYREGELSRLKAHLVSATHLYGVARRLDLGSYLELGRSEEMSGGRAKKTLLVDALEALIAAIYLDGGAVPVRDFVAAHVLDAAPCDDLAMDSEVQSSITNFKSALQELAQSRKWPGTLQDLHGRGSGRQGMDRAGRGRHQETGGAAGGPPGLPAHAPGTADRRTRHAIAESPTVVLTPVALRWRNALQLSSSRTRAYLRRG